MLITKAQELSEALEKTLEQEAVKIHEAVALLIECIRGEGKILICGNGGSASQAQHFSAELVVRFMKERQAIAAIALNTDSSILTAAGNDYGYEQVFARQVDALANSGDVLVCLSTSGNSKNVVNAAVQARSKGCKVLSLTGQADSVLMKKSDVIIRAQTKDTAHAQEIHLFLIHHFADKFDHEFSSE